MAFIREYAEAGDPFRLRLPRGLKKLGGKVFRGVGKIARAGIGFVPGGGIAMKVAGAVARRSGIAQRLLGIAHKHGLTADHAMQFARAYGIDMGDPEDYEDFGGGMSRYMNDDAGDYMGDPGGKAPKPAKKRKTAGAGPKHKAEKKREKRKERAARKGGPKFDLAKLGEAAAGGIPFVGGLLSEGITQLKGGAAGTEDAAFAEMAQALGGKKGKRLPGMGGPHRRVNVTNVKALRRGLRRVEGFAKLAQKVQKDASKILRHVHRDAGSGSARHIGRSRGHKAGCGCVVCSRRAA
jgi:hypothetical protein